MAIMAQRAVFLDKDGTLIEEVPYNVDPALIRFLPGTADGLCALHAAGFRLIVVSNQSGVAHGYFAEEALAAVEARLRDLFAAAGVPLAGFYYCPHHPDGSVPEYAVSCVCRKPFPGLILRAAREHGIDRARSWFVGDILHDIEAGHRAGCRAILIANGNETVWERSPARTPDALAADLAEAAGIIISSGQWAVGSWNSAPPTAHCPLLGGSDANDRTAARPD
jgi:D-glycero-D-manno-heptose 1,7-bisphosphate phosphatase